MKPQTAKDLVELYDEYDSFVKDKQTEHRKSVLLANKPNWHSVYDSQPHFVGFIDYLRNKQTEVVEDDWDDHKPQTVGVEFAPLSFLTDEEIALLLELS